jgi:2-dehydropantoate 2-reductase
MHWEALMRFIIYGAGAVGCLIGGKLFMSGSDVVLIARGAHLDAIRRDGLKLKHPHPDAVETLRLPAVGHPSQIDFRDGDVALLTMKSQDTVAALDDLRLAAGDAVPVVCAQNGVENERAALRRFRNAYGMLLIMPAEYLQPGLVETTAWPMTGVCDLGRYPRGTDALAEAVASEITAAGFSAEALPDIMRLKYSKLHQNMVNALQAILPPDAQADDITSKLRAETEACYAAAGIDWAPTKEMMGRMRGGGPPPAGIGSSGWRGGSMWQSVARGTGSSEVDYICGEVVLLGRLHGVQTPANEVVQLNVDRLARTKGVPGSVGVDELREEIRRREVEIGATK